MCRRLKIAVVGPFPDVNGLNIGGVAEFNVSLSNALIKYAQVLSISNSEISSISREVDMYNLKTKHKYSPISFFKILSILNKEKPDIVISSLQYSLPVSFYTKGLKIHFLHGFPSIKYYGKLKLAVMKFLDKMIKNKFDFIFANSNFTKVLNEVFFNNRVDATIPLGVNDDFINNSKRIKGSTKKDIDLLFVGRIVEAKGIFKVLEIVKLLNNTKNNIVFVGDGEDLPRAKKICKDNKLNVKFLGYLDRKKIISLYNRSKIFISLNTHEPFGITYLEAALLGCKIICPNTGGQTEFLSMFGKQVYFLKSDNDDEILKGFNYFKSNNYKSEKNNLSELYYYFSYDRVAKDILSKIEDRLDE